MAPPIIVWPVVRLIRPASGVASGVGVSAKVGVGGLVAAGVASGGRTGLTAVVVGLCMLGAMFFSPLIQAVGAGVNIGSGDAVVMRYPVIAPVLVLVGVLMFGAVRRIDWDDFAEAIPAFLTVIMMQLTVSITDGIAWGFVSYSALSVFAGRAGRTSGFVHAFAVVFVLRYVFLA